MTNGLTIILRDRLQIEANSRQVFGFFSLFSQMTEKKIDQEIYCLIHIRNQITSYKKSNNVLHMHAFVI